MSHLRNNECILVGGVSQERQTVCLEIYDILIIPVSFSFVLSPFQYHIALPKTRMRYRLFRNKCFNNILKWSFKKTKLFKPNQQKIKGKKIGFLKVKYSNKKMRRIFFCFRLLHLLSKVDHARMVTQPSMNIAL